MAKARLYTRTGIFSSNSNAELALTGQRLLAVWSVTISFNYNFFSIDAVGRFLWGRRTVAKRPRTFRRKARWTPEARSLFGGPRVVEVGTRRTNSSAFSPDASGVRLSAPEPPKSAHHTTSGGRWQSRLGTIPVSLRALGRRQRQRGGHPK